MATRSTTALSLLAISAALAGCGGGIRPAGVARPRDGRAVFAEECAICHSLDGGDDPRRQGGDLLGFHASPATLSQFAAEMPVRRPLSGSELRAVVRYVAAIEQRGQG